MKLFRNILLLYLCFNLLGGNLISYIYKFQDSVSSLNISEEEDGSQESKEDADSKEGKFHCLPFELSAAVTYIERSKILLFSDDKIINHSSEIASPPPNC